MINVMSHTGLWVTDQDEALRFYTEVLGFEVRTDVTVEQFSMRWLTVGVPGHEQELVLQSPDVPGLDEGSREQIRALQAKGLNPPLILHVDDCRATIEALRDKGVEISQEPVEQFYGIDAGIRDPSGNHLRITQPARVPVS